MSGLSPHSGPQRTLIGSLSPIAIHPKLLEGENAPFSRALLAAYSASSQRGRFRWGTLFFPKPLVCKSHVRRGPREVPAFLRCPGRPICLESADPPQQ
jgi:hypothetical protein